ncbi:hypothetical protein BC830DRAFT_264655 [Chytriomyces sp. MP71]|nr:hypothetical protein BC830DRAFT_264655 [Chytriomyces sp. MP71]
MPPQAIITAALASPTPTSSAAPTSTDTNSLLPWYSKPVNNSLQYGADMVIFAGMICLTLFLFCSIWYNGGSVFARKTLLLFCVLVTMSGYQYCAAQEVGLATTPIPIISYVKYSFLALTEASFVLYNWSRSYPIILAEVSPRLIAVFRVILIFTVVFCCAQPVACYFGFIPTHTVIIIAALGCLALDLFFATISMRSLNRKRVIVQASQGEDGKGVQIIENIAKYGGRASWYAIWSLISYAVATGLGSIPNENGSSLLGLVFSIMCVLVNLFFLIGCWALVTS